MSFAGGDFIDANGGDVLQITVFETKIDDPSFASLDESILMLCLVLVGGVGNFCGLLVGAAVLIAHFRPQGIAGEYRME